MDKNNTRFLGMLGFAMRAGRVLLGCDIVISAMQNKKASLVIVSDSASEGTKKKIKFKKNNFLINKEVLLPKCYFLTSLSQKKQC